MTSSSAASRKALSKIASNRLQKELVEWQVNPPAGFKHKPTDNLQRWVIEVHGAPGTLYANELFQLQVDFPEHYPMEAPQVIFLPPAPLHPHIYSNGHICLVAHLFWIYYFIGKEACVSRDKEKELERMENGDNREDLLSLLVLEAIRAEHSIIWDYCLLLGHKLSVNL